MLKSNLLLWQRHWNYCSLPASLPSFFRWKITFFQQHSKHRWKCFRNSRFSDSRIFESLVIGVSSFSDTKNTSILNITTDYILSTKRIDVPPTNFWFVLKPNFTIWLSIRLHIAFTLPRQLGSSSNYHYFYGTVLTVFILFVYS